MSYTVINFKTKKALKEAVVNYITAFNQGAPVLNYKENELGAPVRCYNPGLGPNLSNWTGIVYLEGPHYPAPHRWYAEGEMKDGILIKVS